MVVLQDMVGIMAWNDGALNVTKAKQNFLADFKSMIDARYNAPSIVQWTAFNEGDCVQVSDRERERERARERERERETRGR